VTASENERLAVDLTGVGKRFMRHSDRRNSLKERIVRGRARHSEDFWAVRDLSLQIPKGSVYGLIGHNGSGKSTLLKMIGGIYRPTEGSIVTDGRVAALIELGAGFHPDMTGRENIALNGSILGLPRKEIQAVTDEIIDFSGLGDFINDPVKHYSSGMYVRLGFSVAVHMKPDVLLIDEVLAVGDEEFQRKCFDHLYQLRRSGRTIIVVSHGLGQLEGLCDEIAWLERGVMQQHGPAVETIAAYLRKVNAEESARNPMVTAIRGEDDDSIRAGDQTVHVTRADIVDADGEPITHAETGTTFQLRLGVTAPEPVLGPNVRIALQHDSGTLVTMLSNHRWGVDFGTIVGDHSVSMALTDNPLLPGRYRVHVDVFDYTGSRLLDSWNDAVEFAVRSPRGEIGQGLVELPVQITFD
jgi:lipopolysaccharide transport system ATP-binding protein